MISPASEGVKDSRPRRSFLTPGRGSRYGQRVAITTWRNVLTKKWPALMIMTLVALPMLVGQTPDDVRTVARGANTFAWKMFSQIAPPEGNVFFSPYSISSALAMTYVGARGRTAGQMADVLGFSLAPDKLYPALSGLMAGLNAKDKPYELFVANALWGQARYPFAPAFIQTIDAYFRGGFKEVDFISEAGREEARRAINAWTEGRTANRIKDLIKPGILTFQTRLVLTNAIYFKGKWALQFKAADTRDMPFVVSKTRTASVPMMCQKGEFGYAEAAGVQVLEMRYAGGDLSMVVLLPTSSSSVEKLQEALPDRFESWLAALVPQSVDVFLPRFKLEQEFILNDQLAALGMSDAFSEQAADFAGMRSDGKKDLSISKVVHKAFVEVNEEGTEAAAATAVVMGIKSISMTPVFKADHPFVFLIRDVRTGTILFLGRMSSPR